MHARPSWRRCTELAMHSLTPSCIIAFAFGECSDICAGDTGSLTTGQCIEQLDCYNSGGQTTSTGCGIVDEENNCRTAELCNTEIGFCPGQSAASSTNACDEAQSNMCTIDDCQ